MHESKAISVGGRSLIAPPIGTRAGVIRPASSTVTATISTSIVVHGYHGVAVTLRCHVATSVAPLLHAVLSTSAMLTVISGAKTTLPVTQQILQHIRYYNTVDTTTQ